MVLCFRRPPVGRADPAEPVTVAVRLLSGCSRAQPSVTARCDRKGPALDRPGRSARLAPGPSSRRVRSSARPAAGGAALRQATARRTDSECGHLHSRAGFQPPGIVHHGPRVHRGGRRPRLGLRGGVYVHPPGRHLAAAGHAGRQRRRRLRQLRPLGGGLRAHRGGRRLREGLHRGGVCSRARAAPGPSRPSWAPPTPPVGDNFGHSVAISGPTTTAVGAPTRQALARRMRSRARKRHEDNPAPPARMASGP